MSDVRAALLAQASAIAPAPVAGIDGAFVRALSLADVDDLPEEGDRRVALIIACVCDQGGKPLFTDADADALSRMPFRAATLLLDAINSANGFGAAAGEDALKN